MSALSWSPYLDIDEARETNDNASGSLSADSLEQPLRELLVLSGRGVIVGVLGHYGLFDEAPDLAAAIKAARAKLAKGHARAFVAFRIEAAVIDGIDGIAGIVGTERELVRFEIYPDRVALVPVHQGGLSDEQKTKALALPKKGLL